MAPLSLLQLTHATKTTEYKPNQTLGKPPKAFQRSPKALISLVKSLYGTNNEATWLYAISNLPLWLYSPVTKSLPPIELSFTRPFSWFFTWHLKDLFASLSWTRDMKSWPSGSITGVRCLLATCFGSLLEWFGLELAKRLHWIAVDWSFRAVVVDCGCRSEFPPPTWVPSSSHPTTCKNSRAWGASWHLNRASFSTVTNWSGTLISNSWSITVRFKCVGWERAIWLVFHSITFAVPHHANCLTSSISGKFVRPFRASNGLNGSKGSRKNFKLQFKRAKINFRPPRELGRKRKFILERLYGPQLPYMETNSSVNSNPNESHFKWRENFLKRVNFEMLSRFRSKSLS